jgi:putative flippase GtrA
MRRVPRQCPNCRGGDVSAVQSLYERFRHLGHEVAKFGSVGAAAFVIDVGVFNVLTATSSPLHHKVLTAKAVSTTLAATFAYFANRQWTWKDRIRSGLGREYGLFFLFNAIGLGIAETCLAISEYGLHEHSALGARHPVPVLGLPALGVRRRRRATSYRRGSLRRHRLTA